MIERARELTRYRVRPEELHRFCVDAMVASGLSKSHAEATAEVLVRTDAWGTFTHGTRQTLPLMRNVKTGVVLPDSEPTVVAEGQAWALVDGNHAISMVTSRLATDIAIRKARDAGVAFVGVKRSGHYGAAGYYAVQAAEQDMIGISVSNVDARMTVPGARVPVIGTNPLAYAVPTRGRPVFLDIATSVVAASKILTARAAGTRIPDNWMVDERGLPSTDPSIYPERGVVVPMAGHKGYGIALLIEILSGVLTGAAVLSRVGNWLADEPEVTDQGHAFIVIDVNTLMPLDRFKDRMEAAMAEIRSAPRAEGVDRIYVPGEMEWERYAEAYDRGIKLPDFVILNLLRLAEQTGLVRELEAIFRET